MTNLPRAARSRQVRRRSALLHPDVLEQPDVVRVVTAADVQRHAIHSRHCGRAQLLAATTATATAATTATAAATGLIFSTRRRVAAQVPQYAVEAAAVRRLQVAEHLTRRI